MYHKKTILNHGSRGCFFSKECDLKQYKQKILLIAIEYDLKECARNVKNTLITKRPQQSQKALERLRRIWINLRELEQVLKQAPF